MKIPQYSHHPLNQKSLLLNYLCEEQGTDINLKMHCSIIKYLIVCKAIKILFQIMILDTFEVLATRKYRIFCLQAIAFWDCFSGPS